MSEEIINNLLTTIFQSNMQQQEKDAAIRSILQLSSSEAKEGDPKPKENPTRHQKPTKGILKFTKKELSTMPKEFQKAFICDDKIIKYRYYQGLFQARYRCNGICIEVASKSFELMKQKFIDKLNQTMKEIPSELQARTIDVPFSTYGRDWLDIKKLTVKASTYKEYVRAFTVNLEPKFGNLPLSKIDRQMIQDYLFTFVEANKHRTAEKLKLQLTCIFDMAYEDFGLPSPMKKIVLPYRETKKGSALTKEEERALVEYCTKKNDDVGSALLVLLYFGLRQSELASLRIIDNQYLECETSKERLGRTPTRRKIPFTPVFKRILPLVNFEAAKNVNLNKLKSAFRRFMPTHHAHELRYTFITRCKEAHVNTEVVMLWDGHKSDSDVRSSKVDRGYTDYSEEYILAEAEKVDYTF